MGARSYILSANAISRRAADGRPYIGLCEPFDKSKFEVSKFSKDL